MFRRRSRGAQGSAQRLSDSISGLQHQIPPISFQVTRAIEATSENKKGIDAAHDRIDRVVESFGGKLDNVIDTIKGFRACSGPEFARISSEMKSVVVLTRACVRPSA
jgi:hypothetical protein